MAETKTRPRKKPAASRNGSSDDRSKGPSNGSGNGSAPEKGRSRPPADNAGLDAMLTDATMSGISRWLPGRSIFKATAKLATRPNKVARRTLGLYAEMAKIAAGRSEVAPHKS